MAPDNTDPLSMEPGLADLGWRPFFQQQMLGNGDEDLPPARALAVHRSVIRVAGEGIEADLPVPINLADGPIAVGDWLVLDAGRQRILRVLERSSLFRRRAPGTESREQLIAANIDTLFIVSSCNQDFNVARLERYLAIAREAGVMPVVVLTKADLCEDSADYVQAAARLSPGLIVDAVNALDATSLDCLGSWLERGQTIALLGSSGVGKSTLANTLSKNDAIATQGIRAGDDKGRHTTTARHMHRLPGGAWLLDTPGMRELQLTDVQAGLDDVFAEIVELANDCRFADCSHVSEPGCAVLAAIDNGQLDPDRVKRWRKLVREEASNRESIAERRARDKSLGRLYRNILSESHRLKGR
jgi:ribosome biogenesis GTPase